MKRLYTMSFLLMSSTTKGKSNYESCYSGIRGNNSSISVLDLFTFVHFLILDEKHAYKYETKRQKFVIVPIEQNYMRRPKNIH